MEDNIFIKKYELKTDTQLERIINDTTHTELARKTAIKVLKERNGQTELIEKAEINFEAIKQNKILVKQKIDKEEEKQNFITNDPDAPEFYSKRVITTFAAIFSTIFGAVLMMSNFKEADNEKSSINFWNSLYYCFNCNCQFT